MEIYKFGGASVKDAEGVKNLAEILKNASDMKLLVVISAMGKTTNALEKLATSYFTKKDDAWNLLNEIKGYHLNIINELFPAQDSQVFDDINNAFVEIEWVLEDEPQDSFDFIYDQIVSIGEILSTKIVSYYLQSVGIKCKWIDARAYIQTDNTYREAKIDWDKTQNLISKNLPELLNNHIIITQGFIGNTSENFTTTLGREGSDFTAAIFANCLDADRLTIWKDVPGILNADPKLYNNTIKFDELSYAEAIEMTYYGATVIHPKTIKPLQNKHIPLYVKPFMAPLEFGTVIKEAEVSIKTPIIILKKNQILLSIFTKDFSFITEEHLRDLFKAFTEHHIKVNMMQISALSFSACFDYDSHKFEILMALLADDFSFRYNNHLKLITIRHADESSIPQYINMSDVLLEQRSRSTVQFVLKDSEHV